MGAEPWIAWVPGELDPEKALKRAQSQVFSLGSFRGAERHPKSIEDAREVAAEDGTRSVLDVRGISDGEEPGMACGVPVSELEGLFGSNAPAKDAVVSCIALWSEIGRGCARYVVAYDGERLGILFLGYSYD